jgi:hypothetical protein
VLLAAGLRFGADVVSNVTPVSKSKHLDALYIQNNLTLSSTAFSRPRNDNPVCERVGKWPCQFIESRAVTHKHDMNVFAHARGIGRYPKPVCNDMNFLPCSNTQMPGTMTDSI